MSWVDLEIERNLSWRAERIMAEIKATPEPEHEDVPDSELTLAEIASAVQNGRLARTFAPRWRVE